MANRLDAMYQGRTLVFGHRGAKAYAPMNTLPAFELAVEQGADGVELDVHFSKDRALVVLHDFTVDDTTDGSGRVKDMTLAQLKALDAGGWFGEKFKDTRIPTLDEVFEAVGQTLYINVEIKVEAADTEGLEQAVADCIARFDMQSRVIVSSFDLAVLERFRKIMPDVAAGYLYFSPITDERIRESLRELQFEALHPHHMLIDADFIAQANGFRVHTWTVNDVARAVELRDLGVDLIISDNPDAILRALGR